MENRVIVNRGFVDSRTDGHIVEVSDVFESLEEAMAYVGVRKLHLTKNEYLEITDEDGNLIGYFNYSGYCVYVCKEK